MLEAARRLHAKVQNAEGTAKSDERRRALAHFATTLERSFYDFEPDFFQQNVSRIVDDEVRLIRSSLEIWPTLLEIVYFRKSCHALPMHRVKPGFAALRKPAESIKPTPRSEKVVAAQ